MLLAAALLTATAKPSSSSSRRQPRRARAPHQRRDLGVLELDQLLQLVGLGVQQLACVLFFLGSWWSLMDESDATNIMHSDKREREPERAHTSNTHNHSGHNNKPNNNNDANTNNNLHT